MEQKTRIVVEGHRSEEDNPYIVSGINYALVSSPKDGRRQCTGFLQCRDYIHEMVRAHVQKDHGLSFHYKPGEDPPIDMEKLRLLIATSDHVEAVFKKNLFNAKKIINFYEKVAGWSESKITTVTHKTRKNVWLLTGPKEWMSYPNLLSMVTLILRIGAVHGPIEFKDRETLEEAYKEIIDGHQSDLNWCDVTYLKQCYKKFYFIMEHNRELFTLPLEEVYPSAMDGLFFHGQGGIVSMCEFEASNKELNKRFRELSDREYKERENV